MQISVKGIDHAIRTIERYADLRQKLAELAERLCKIGEPIINQTHGHHAVVTTEPTQTGYKITASGTDVLFIEFGTGNATGKEAGKYDAVPQVALTPGSWSAANGGEYAATGGYPNGYWHFGGNKYTETPPHPSFYYAYQAMAQALPQLAKEVFGSG